MSCTVRHCYIPAPLDTVQKAWQAWSNRADGVHFIPAEGGCFVVAVGETARPSLHLPWPRRGRHSGAVGERDLERFRDLVESGRFSRRPRSTGPLFDVT
jgi:hypothetical protein